MVCCRGSSGPSLRPVDTSSIRAQNQSLGSSTAQVRLCKSIAWLISSRHLQKACKWRLVRQVVCVQRAVYVQGAVALGTQCAEAAYHGPIV
jgi:hypothetical protein